MIGYLASALAAGAATFAGMHTMVPWSQLYGKNFNGVREGTKILALTYDDGPNDPWTMKLLDVLAKHQAQATFFMLGKYVRQRPEIARAVHEAGHAIGNHSFSHPNLIFCSAARVRQEIEDTNEAIFDATGQRPYLFRPPFGGRRPGTFKLVQSMNLQPVMWRVTCFDWSAKSTDQIMGHVHRQTAGGEVILLHDGGHLRMGEDRSRTVEATDRILTEYKDHGYMFVNVHEMLQMRPEAELPFNAPKLGR